MKNFLKMNRTDVRKMKTDGEMEAIGKKKNFRATKLTWRLKNHQPFTFRCTKE